MTIVPPSRLRVTIVGAGLGGLSAAIGLREFCDVTILESTSHLGEIGAAVHLGPNAHRIVKDYGADPLGHGAVPCVSFQEWRAKDDKLVVERKWDPKAEGGVETALCHRVDLQQELYALAVSSDGPGAPCKVHFGTRVASCDPEAGSVTTTDGTVWEADVVVAADGIRSFVRQAVVGDAFHSVASGFSAYRTLLKAEHISASAATKDLGLLDGQLTVVMGDDKRIVMYPTRNKELLNMVAILPDKELNELSEEKWSAPGDVSAMVQSFSSFPKRWTDLLSLTETCGLWQLRDQDPLEHWVRGRTILIGDAAHAMLPYQGQGASQAVEDGEALAAFLRCVPAADVNAALMRVFKVRYRRATYMQEVSRGTGLGELRDRYLAKLGMNKDDPNGVVHAGNHFTFIWKYFGAEEWEKTHPDWVVSS